MAREPGMYYFQHRRADIGEHWHDGYLSNQSLQQLVQKLEHRRLQGTNKKREYRIINWQEHVIKTWPAETPVGPVKEQEKGVVDTAQYELFWISDSETEGKWKHFDPIAKQYSGIDAAIKRCEGTMFTGQLVRVWEDGKIIYERVSTTDELVWAMREHKEGRQEGAMATQRYEVQYMRSDDRAWKKFRSTETGSYFDGLTDAYEWARNRSRQNKNTLYRVWNLTSVQQEGSPYLNGTTNNAQQEASRRTGGNGISQDTTTNMKEYAMEYEPRKALNVGRTTLIEKMEEGIAAARARHDEAKTEAEAAAATKIEALRELVESNPTAFVKMIEGYVSSQFFVKSNDKLEYAQGVIDGYNGTTSEFVPDPQATKLISVLNAAVDETIEVTPSDDFYRYL